MLLPEHRNHVVFWFMADEIQTRELPPLTQRAAFIPSTVSTEKRTVELTWTTGAPVLRGYWDRFWEELSLDPKHIRMERLNNGAPFLRDHAAWSVDATLGVVERAWLLKSEGRALVRFPRAEDDPEADKVFRKIADGILQNVSVGYRVYKMEKVADGEDKIPVMRAVDWEPYEISLVPVGADDGAGIRSSPRTAPNAVEVINTRGMAPQKEGSMADEKQSTAPAAEVARAQEPTDEAKLKAERERVATINALARKHDLPSEKVDAFIRDGATLDTVRTYALDTLAERSNKGGPGETAHVSVEVGVTAKDKQRGQKVAWLLQRANAGDLLARASKHAVHGHLFRDLKIDPGEARGMTLLDMARDFLAEQKVNTRGMSAMEVAGRALSHRSGGYQGTDTFPVLFEQALHKILLAAYATQGDTWRLFCGTDTVPDFRSSNRYRTGEFGTLDVVPENAEYKYKAIPDGSKVQISTETRGNLITLSRQAIINDDMGALADTAAKFGRMAGRTIEVNVYALLAQNSGLGPTMPDSNPFFHASRGNVGTGSALGVAGLSSDKRLMRKQKDPNNVDFIDLNPRTLLISDALEDEANILNASEFEPRDNNFRKPNAVRGLFSTIVGTPRLEGTRRYLFADPTGGAEAFKVVFLEGQGELPFMDSEEGFSVDGTTWKIRQDVKVVPFDPKGAVTNAGA